MKTAKYHHTNMGKFAPTEYADTNGYITIHASDRYAKATDEQLANWAASSSRAVRAAAATEIAERNLASWRDHRSN